MAAGMERGRCVPFLGRTSAGRSSPATTAPGARICGEEIEEGDAYDTWAGVVSDSRNQSGLGLSISYHTKHDFTYIGMD